MCVQYSPFNINQLAAALKTHRSRLTRLFHEKTGISPIDYLISLRIQQGFSLLRDSSLRLTEIAIASGFSSPDYFSKAIKKASGMSPRQLRAL